MRNEMQSKSRDSVISTQFREDLRHWAETDRRILIKVLDLMDAVGRDPFKGIGKPEPLKGDLKGYWSRRINDEDRLVYKVTEDFIIIRSMKEHYN